MDEQLELQKENPYAKGFIVSYEDGTSELQTELSEYPARDLDEFDSFNVGDSLTSLAGKYYSNSKLWYVLYHANLDVINDPLNLPVGKSYRIPYLNDTLI